MKIEFLPLLEYKERRNTVILFLSYIRILTTEFNWHAGCKWQCHVDFKKCTDPLLVEILRLISHPIRE